MVVVASSCSLDSSNRLTAAMCLKNRIRIQGLTLLAESTHTPLIMIKFLFGRPAYEI